MGATHITPENEGPGNAAYQQMRALLAEVQRSERNEG